MFFSVLKVLLVLFYSFSHEVHFSFKFSLAEPVSELQKSYEQFLHRMELFKKRKAKVLLSSVLVTPVSLDFHFHFICLAAYTCNVTEGSSIKKWMLFER